MAKDDKQRLAAIIKKCCPRVDIERSQDFVRDGTLDSFGLVSLIAALEQEYRIQIEGLDVVPENFSNLSAIMGLLSQYGVEVEQ